MTEILDVHTPKIESDLPEQSFNHTVLQLTQTVRNILGKKAGGLSAGAGIAILAVNGAPLLSITPRYIRIAALRDVDQLKTRTDLPTTKVVDQEAFQSAINTLSPHIVRLNKLGIDCISDDFERDTACLEKCLEKSKELTSKGSVHLYEEEQINPREKWLSMGNTDNWYDPLLEIVLSKKNGPHRLSPAFLMDFDTNLSFKELKALLEPFYGPDFFQWKLDVPNIGTVLAIGKIGDINGRKITLGFGTNLRNTEWQREHLKLL